MYIKAHLLFSLFFFHFFFLSLCCHLSYSCVFIFLFSPAFFFFSQPLRLHVGLFFYCFPCAFVMYFCLFVCLFVFPFSFCLGINLRCSELHQKKKTLLFFLFSSGLVVTSTLLIHHSMVFCVYFVLLLLVSFISAA